MSLPKIRPGPGTNRRDVKVSLQCAEQHLVKQKALLEADHRKRQVELERSELKLAKSFGTFAGVRTRALPAAGMTTDEARGNSSSSRGSRCSITRRHSLNSGALTSQITKLVPKHDPKCKSGRRGSVDANMSMRASLLSETSNPVPEGCQTDVNVNRQNIIGCNNVENKALEKTHAPKETATVHGNHSNATRNAVFVFKYEDKNDKLETQPALSRCPSTGKARSLFEVGDANYASGPLPSALAMRRRSGSPRKNLHVKIMTPVRELNSPKTDDSEQEDSGASIGSDNSSCGTKSSYSASNDSLGVVLSSSTKGSQATLTSGSGRESLKINSHQNLSSSEIWQYTYQQPKSQMITDEGSSSQVIGKSVGRHAREAGDVFPPPRLPPQSYLTQRRRSIAVVEDIGQYKKIHTSTFENSSLVNNQEPKPAGKPAPDTSPSHSYLSRRRGSTSVLCESFGREKGELRPVVGMARDGALPAVAKPVRLGAEARRQLAKAREREAAWEYLRRSHYLQGIESDII